MITPGGPQRRRGRRNEGFWGPEKNTGGGQGTRGRKRGGIKADVQSKLKKCCQEERNPKQTASKVIHGTRSKGKGFTDER